MKTHELAKHLDGLARALRSLTSEASEAVSKALELERRRGYLPANKYEPKALTLAEISAALSAATRRPAASVELRKDVYERRCERLSATYADLFHVAVKACKSAPTGVRFSCRYTSQTDGPRYLQDSLPAKFGKTTLNAEACAWERASWYVLGRIVPDYGYNGIYSFSCQAINRTENYVASSRLEDKIRGLVDRWLAANTFVLCDVDTAGGVLRINGLDPAPFIEMANLVAAGNADPLGILKVGHATSSL